MRIFEAMRIVPEQARFFKEKIKAVMPMAAVYLFGSRADNRLKGGDIDILVVGERILSTQEKRDIKIEFYKKFGEQKVDIVSYLASDRSNFKKMILKEAVAL